MDWTMDDCEAIVMPLSRVKFNTFPSGNGEEIKGVSGYYGLCNHVHLLSDNVL